MSPTNHFGDEQVQPWTLARIYDDLVCLSEIGVRLNVRTRRVTDWIMNRERVKCPRPVKRLGHVDVYSFQEWADWYAAWEESHKTYRSFNGFKPHQKNVELVRSVWGPEAVEDEDA